MHSQKSNKTSLYTCKHFLSSQQQFVCELGLREIWSASWTR